MTTNFINQFFGSHTIKNKIKKFIQKEEKNKTYKNKPDSFIINSVSVLYKISLYTSDITVIYHTFNTFFLPKYIYCIQYK